MYRRSGAERRQKDDALASRPERREGITRRLLDRLQRAQVGGCTCLTKTPELSYHKDTCHYRLFEEATAALFKMEARAAEASRIRGRVLRAEVWFWQGDEYDNPDSLSCPVIMSADAVRELVGARESEVHRLQLALGDAARAIPEVAGPVDHRIRTFRGEWSVRLLNLENRNIALEAEVARLKAGRLTPAEVHNLCHNLPSTVPVCEFAAGCAEEQRKWYGSAPDADLLQTLVEAIDAACVRFYEGSTPAGRDGAVKRLKMLVDDVDCGRVNFRVTNAAYVKLDIRMRELLGRALDKLCELQDAGPNDFPYQSPELEALIGEVRRVSERPAPPVIDVMAVWQCLLQTAYRLGFEASREGHNGEYGCHEPEADDDWVEKRDAALLAINVKEEAVR